MRALSCLLFIAVLATSDAIPRSHHALKKHAKKPFSHFSKYGREWMQMEEVYEITVPSVAIAGEFFDLMIKDKATQPSNEMELADFIQGAKANLDLNLVQDAALARIFHLFAQRSQSLSKQQFLDRFSMNSVLQSMVRSYLAIKTVREFRINMETYDFDKTTKANYRVEGTEFAPTFKELREKLDLNYHGNYAMERQLWQDAMVQAVAVKSEPREDPWIVFTCGPMGTGKGYVMQWLSDTNKVPLDNVVHIDPDHFKTMMPEFKEYVSRGKQAGSETHQESGMLMEIVQEVALANSQHIVVDGSLRDGGWYSQVFMDIRKRFPNYRLAIFYVYATEAIIRQRIEKRRIETGRGVPEELIVDSLNAPDRSLAILVNHVDFLARIKNDGGTPELTAFETVDRSGQFDHMAAKFASSRDSCTFPCSIPSMSLVPVSLTKNDISVTSGVGSFTFSISNNELINGLASQFPTLSQARGGAGAVQDVNLPSEARALASIPEQATTFRWMGPLLSSPDDVDTAGSLLSHLLKSGETRETNLVVQSLPFLMNGGFAYFNSAGELLSINALEGFVEDTEFGTGAGFVLQFGEPSTMDAEQYGALTATHSLQPATLPRLKLGGADKMAWVPPNNGACPYGCFAFTFEDFSIDKARTTKDYGKLFPVWA